jgi:hypothetical protein
VVDALRGDADRERAVCGLAPSRDKHPVPVDVAALINDCTASSFVPGGLVSRRIRAGATGAAGGGRGVVVARAQREDVVVPMETEADDELGVLACLRAAGHHVRPSMAVACQRLSDVLQRAPRG